VPILSADEVSALRTPASTRGADGAAAVRYNFRRPDRVSKEQIHSINFLHDRFARNLATSLAAYLRAVTELSIVSVEQFSYAECLQALPDPTAFYALSLAPFEDLGALEINPAIAFAMIDRMLGGDGRGEIPNRALTEIEQNVIDSVVRLILEALTETWKPIVSDLKFGIRGRETRPQMLQVAAPNDVIVMIVFDVRIGESRGFINVCLPASMVESAGTEFVQAWKRQDRVIPPQERIWVHEHLSRMPMTISPVIETRLTGREVLALEPGDVVSLGHPVDEPIELRVGGLCKFVGRMVATDRRVLAQVDRRSAGTAAGR
jgi:flagellar motor switch protein FliM